MEICYPQDTTTINDCSDHSDNLISSLETMRRKILFIRYLKVTENQEMRPYELGKTIKKEFPDFCIFIEMLRNCHCCHVHKLHKPVSNISLDACDYRICCSIPAPTQTKKACSCPCRHIARQIVRAHNYTKLEYIEDKRHLLHIDLLNCTESKKQLETELHEHNQVKNKLKENLRKNCVHPSVYTKYYNTIDKLIEVKMQYTNIQMKIEESKFHIRTHISDHPEVFTSADAMFEKHAYN